MPEILLTILIAALLYLLPGYLLLQLVDLHVDRTTRFFIALCLSLIIVPCVFIAVGNIYSFIPAGLPWLILVLTIIAGVVIVIVRRSRLVINAVTAGGVPGAANRWEKVIAWGWIAIFPLVALLPRLDMFIFGGSTRDVGTWDETWHLAQLVSVARTGLPPQHYLFPSISLSYYYGSWIYPAVVGNLPWFEVPLSRAMAIQAYVVTFAFLGIVYCYLLANYRKGWVRLAGLAFFTILGGFDLYASLTNPANAEWWQGTVGWLVSGFQVSQFVTLYAWVPQHVAGGIAFVFTLLVWKNSSAPPVLKGALTALSLAFCFTTSPFVFLFFVLAVVIYAALHARSLIAAVRQAPLKLIATLGIALAIFLVITWQMVFGVTGRTSFELSGLRVPLFEGLIGANRWSILFDRILTFLGFPLVASWIGLIEIGLPFILYLAWLIRRLYTREGFPDRFDALFAVFPAVSLLVVMTIQDVGGGGNLAMRGLIPAQILVLLAALQPLESFTWPLELWKRLVIVYLAGCFLFAQGASALAEVRADSLPVLNETRQHLAGKPSMSWLKPHEYIAWLNKNTPRNALILEAGCITAFDQPAYRWLERSRYIMPACGMQMDSFDRDRDFYVASEWQQLKQLAQGSGNILELYQASNFRLKGKLPVYLVSWGSDPQWVGSGEQVYQDSFVTIYQLP